MKTISPSTYDIIKNAYSIRLYGSINHGFKIEFTKSFGEQAQHATFDISRPIREKRYLDSSADGSTLGHNQDVDISAIEINQLIPVNDIGKNYQEFVRVIQPRDVFIANLEICHRRYIISGKCMYLSMLHKVTIHMCRNHRKVALLEFQQSEMKIMNG